MKKPKDEKAAKIKSALRGAPRGLWVREVARQTGLDKSTCSRHLEALVNAGEIEFEWLGRNKVYRLKAKQPRR